MLNFTPGEWKCFPGNFVRAPTPSDAQYVHLEPLVCTVGEPTYSWKYEYERGLIMKTSGDMESNARLITAAPKMYEMLRRFRETDEKETNKKLWNEFVAGFSDEAKALLDSI